MAKFDYWHIITELNPEWSKDNPQMKVGMVVTHHRVSDGCWVTLMDINTGKTGMAYKLKYLKRLPKDMSGVERLKALKVLIKKNEKSVTPSGQVFTPEMAGMR